MDNKEVISTLNDLIEISKDGEEGFRNAADNVEVTPLKEYFLDRSQQVASSVHELQDLVRTLGGQPETESSVSGALHRRWLDFKTALTSNDTVAVLNETERGEDVALARYKKAIQKELPATVRNVVQRQLEGVQRNHDRVKQLRDAARAEVG
ncbi:PA2169 family four-helix-bundle protein [Methylovorus menthalis]|uniref:PA2169 family four-helix-bundle protein n=1 Tax=Methylovorus menthalis TaxID=1002227 RepID=UPI001E401270|nr:PA2169 family four-helix-bundle protein [Methylovorus menthalis]MCB4811810.1 PA2169 family four-helix-bundle protein [Methylovorus menthalis]